MSIGVTDAVASNYGLAFSISPAKKKPKDKKSNEDDEEYILTLAPFTKTPKINFGTVKANTLVERNLLIINPQDFAVKLNVSNQELEINNMELDIGRLSNIGFKIKWQPDKPDYYKYTILFEVTNCARLKFIVHAFGICVKPQEMPKIRKPLTMLQPLKKEKSAQFQDESKSTLASTKPSGTKIEAKLLNKENKEVKKLSGGVGLAQTVKKASTATCSVSVTTSTTTTMTTTVKKQSSGYASFNLNNHLSHKPKQDEWALNFYKIEYDKDTTTANDDLQKTYINKQLDSTDLRRQTCIISSPRVFKNNQNDLYCSNDNLFSNAIYNDYTSTKTPVFKRSNSTNNIVSPSYLSFVDKTVIVVAGTEQSVSEEDTTIHKNSTRNSPTVFSTLKKTNNETKYFNDDDSTPMVNFNKEKSLFGPQIEKQEASLTPKLSDFLKPSSLFNQNSLLLSCEKTAEQILSSTKVASTKLIDMTLGLSTVNSSSALIGSTTMLITPKTCKLAKQLSDPNEKNIISMSYEDAIVNKTPISLIDYYESINALDMLVNAVVLCQKIWRMKKFRECLMGLRKEEITNRISMFSRDITIVLEKQRAKEEYEFKKLKYTIMCQRAIRMKRFRTYLSELKARLEQERLENLIKFALVCQRKWRLIMFRKKLNELRKKELEYKARFLRYTIMCQKLIRMKLFRKHLNKLIEMKENERKEKEYQECVLKYTIMCQRIRRMIIFRKYLNILRLQRQKEKEEFNRLVSCTIVCQRAIRMKLFRKKLKNLREERMELIKQATLVQRVYRMRKFRRCLAVLLEEKRIREENERNVLINKSAKIIQQKWRLFKFRKQMNLYRSSAIKIQNWFRHDMRDRVSYLKLRRSMIILQKIYKAIHAKRVQAALVIQKNWRMKLQVEKYKKITSSIVLIQKWFRYKHDRIIYLRLKRSLPLVQLKCKKYVEKRTKAACLIQKQYRMYKFRREMNMFRNAAICIQRWTRSMSERYLFLKKVRVIFQIQALYRRIYMPRRISASLKIQNAWRCLIARRVLEQKRKDYELKLKLEMEQRYLNTCATRVQALWRGYQIRKETNPILNTIRSRLSIYGLKPNGNENTLGARIRNSLKILKYPNVEIQQLIFALTDMDKVTRLSPECCQIFIKEGALNILYAFIENCNRSVPHMDLIKYCLQVFINLAKYSTTANKVLEPVNAIPILIKLLETNSSINPTIYQFNIFMNVCILFIILSQYDPVVKYVIAQEGCFVKKLQSMYPVLERRTNLKLRKQQEKQAASTITSSKEQLLNSTYVSATPNSANNNVENKKGFASVTFTLEPEWSLTKKSSVEFNDLFSAMDYLIDSYGIKIETALAVSTNIINTPRRNTPLGSIKEMSSKKSAKKIDDVDCDKMEENANGSKVSRKLIMKYQSQIKSISSLKTAGQNSKPILIKQSNLKSTRITQMESQSSAEMEQMEYDDHISICSNESYRSTTSNTTIRSIASFHSERPRMNSTSIIPSKTTIPIIKRSNTDTSSHPSVKRTPSIKQKNSN